MSVNEPNETSRIRIANDMRGMGLHQPDIWGIIATETGHDAHSLDSDHDSVPAYELGKQAASGIDFSPEAIKESRHLIMHPAFGIGEQAVFLAEYYERRAA